jgi:hypothetical protein
VAYHKQEPEIPALTMSFEHRKSAEIAHSNGRVFKEHQLEVNFVEPATPSPTQNFSNNGSNSQVEELDSLEGEEVSFNMSAYVLVEQLGNWVSQSAKNTNPEPATS